MAKISDEDREVLTAYLDGEMDDDQSHALEARLGREPDLRAELNAMRQAWGLLDYLPRAQPSPSFTERTMSRLSMEKMPSNVSSSTSASRVAPISPSTGWGLRPAIVASLLLAMLGGFGLRGLSSAAKNGRGGRRGRSASACSGAFVRRIRMGGMIPELLKSLDALTCLAPTRDFELGTPGDAIRIVDG
ncbi:MAG: hypothetical protein U0744_05180 [Gemmataceae bacterium]